MVNDVAERGDVVILWGGLLFWGGYHVAPVWRAPGFDWTFLTTLLVGGCFVRTLF